MKTDMKAFIAAIAIMGAIRFAMTVAGLPDSTVKYASMTIIILAGTIYFALVSPTRKERLKAAYLLILPYMIIEVLALGFTWATGRHTIFHTPPYDFGATMAQHTIGHLVGGLTWEPLTVWVFMELLWGISYMTKLASTHLAQRKA